ncbi:HNH endonuclease [Streptomyces sp. NPDC057702]|uniref:HNH endonuclease n=1 Tax=unclassified Streptomyces TaxID=2593676 RepID=UPI0036741B17
MIGREFYAGDASARASWRLVVLMGANTRTYKFALGRTLLEFGRRGRDAVPLAEFAAAYGMAMAERVGRAAQASPNTPLGERDFLTVARRESPASLAAGEPTERLVAAAAESIPEMVLRTFHNLRGGGPAPHTFYALTGRGRDRVLRLTPDLLRVAESEQAAGLAGELDARWSIVECAFDAEVGVSLVREGVAVDWETLSVTDVHRRRSVTGVREATVSFQHGRCLICQEVLAPDDATAVDHVFPHALMRRLASVGGWRGPDLDVLWNLAPVHASCNGAKSDRMPTAAELARLAARNEAIMDSPHPLSSTLRLSREHALPGRRVATWAEFLDAVRSTV